MARITGPLHSAVATGQFAKLLIFQNQNGKAIVKKNTKPKVANTLGHSQRRNAFRVAGECVRWCKATTMIQAGKSVTDKDLLTTAITTDQTWNDKLVSAIIGRGGVNYQDAIQDGQADFADTEYDDWDAAASALNPPFRDVAQGREGSSPASPMGNGIVYFHYRWGLFILGLAPRPGADPPVYY